jgi:hypothetical protein
MERVCKRGLLVGEATVKGFTKPWKILIDIGASGYYAPPWSAAIHSLAFVVPLYRDVQRRCVLGTALKRCLGSSRPKKRVMAVGRFH